MAAAPLPPHERQWRHPSELAPTADSLEPSSAKSRILVVSSGAVAAVLVAVMVLTVTPRRSNAPSAISATTTPAASVQLRTNGLRTDQIVRVGQSNLSAGSTAAALVGAPNAISSAPTADPAGLGVATGSPLPSDRVIVLTSSFTYDVAWGDVGDLMAPSGSIVMTREGELLATFVDGRLVLLFD